jgi:5-methylcytosine-specific restriction endonuclease McrA
MPTTPPRPCRHPACPALVEHGGNGLCPSHQSDAGASQRNYDATTRKDSPARAFAAQVRNSTRWQKVRALHKAQNPLCADPFGDHAREGIAAMTEQSHHIVSLEAIWNNGEQEQAYDLANLAPLCTRCHRNVEAMERKGECTRHLFGGAK